MKRKYLPCENAAAINTACFECIYEDCVAAPDTIKSDPIIEELLKKDAQEKKRRRNEWRREYYHTNKRAARWRKV